MFPGSWDSYRRAAAFIALPAGSPVVALAVAFALASHAHAAEELVTLPTRESVTLTIYNEADLTFVRETRRLAFAQGANRIQYSWSNTLIDPSSVDFAPTAAESGLEITDTSFPKETGEALVWTVEALEAGDFEIAISYFTSGISWQSSYEAVLAEAGDSMKLTGSVTVMNNSGEQYDDARVKLVIGSVNLVERIRDLAERAKWNKLRSVFSTATGTFDDGVFELPMPQNEEKSDNEVEFPQDEKPGERAGPADKPKAVAKESVGEYFMYTIEGTETIPNGWAKRIVSVKPVTVKTAQAYYYKPKDYGRQLVRVVEFNNTTDGGFGDKPDPLPPGNVKAYSDAGGGSLGFIASVDVKYTPKGETAKWNLGPDPLVQFEPKKMSEKRENLNFTDDWQGKRLSGYDIVLGMKIELKNYRANPVVIEFHAAYDHPDYDMTNTGAGEKEDAKTYKWRLPLNPGEKSSFEYTVRFREGTNRK